MQAYFILIINQDHNIPLSQSVLNNSGCDTCSLVGTFSVKINWQATRMSLTVLRVQSDDPSLQLQACR